MKNHQQPGNIQYHEIIIWIIILDDYENKYITNMSIDT